MVVYLIYLVLHVLVVYLIDLVVFVCIGQLYVCIGFFCYIFEIQVIFSAKSLSESWMLYICEVFI